MQNLRRLCQRISLEGDRFVFWVVCLGGAYALIR
jgi:hypothetical protein